MKANNMNTEFTAANLFEDAESLTPYHDETPSPTAMAEDVEVEFMTTAQFSVINYLSTDGVSTIPTNDMIRENINPRFLPHITLQEGAVTINVNGLRQEMGMKPLTLTGRIINLPYNQRESQLIQNKMSSEEPLEEESDEAFVPSDRNQEIYCVLSARPKNTEKQFSANIFVEVADAEEFKPLRIPVVVFNYKDGTRDIEPGQSWGVHCNRRNPAVAPFIQDVMYTANLCLEPFGTTERTFASAKEREESRATRTSRQSVARTSGIRPVGTTPVRTPFQQSV